MNKSELFTTTVPENLGIPSASIVNFLNRIENEQINMHGFLLLRRGKIAAEGYWAPYSQNSMHRMYSISKSFVALAIGLMIDEGKLSLDDRIMTYFSKELPEDVHPYLTQTTIRDLLMMAGPHSGTTYSPEDQDWAATYFETKPSHPPGTIFTYDTSATVILNTIVEKLSGTTFLEYMREKFLDPIGFSKDAWCVQTPEGTSWGGSGVICRLRDIAKVAYVCMNKGRWQGKQLISEQYIKEATSKQIDNSIINELGYGYQIWIERNNGFSFRGMGSQFAFCFPEQELMLACISDTQMMADSEATKIIQDAFYEEIFANITDHSLPLDKLNQEKLLEKISGLHIQPVAGEHTSSYVEKINGKWFHLHENPMKITRLRFIFNNDEGIWEYKNETGLHQLEFGIGQKKADTFPETHYFGKKIGTPLGRGYDCLVSGAWVEEHKFNLVIYITDDYLGTANMSFSFKNDQISVQMIKAAEWFLDEYSGIAGGYLAKENGSRESD